MLYISNFILTLYINFIQLKKLIINQIIKQSKLTFKIYQHSIMKNISKVFNNHNILFTCLCNRLQYQPINMISNRRFHLAIQQPLKFDNHINPIPQDNILSKYIESTNNNQSTNKSSPNISFKNKPNNQLKQTKSKKVNYKQILSQNSRGSIITQTYKQTELCLTGLNYANVSYDNIYKSILKFQPDCILVQSKPQNFCQSFQTIKKNTSTQVFSDKLYIQQLNFDKIFNLKDNFTQGNIKTLQTYLFPRKINKTAKQQATQYFPFLSKQIIGQKPLLASIYYQLKKNVPMYLSQIPQTVYRQWICNTHSLMELQQLFKITAKSIPLYPGIKNLTPFQLAAYLFPDQILAINDKYMATIVEIMISLGYKKIMLFGGVAQNEGVMQILKNGYNCDSEGNIDPLINYLIPQKVKGNILRDYDPLQLIQKHILMDTLYHGFDVKNVKLNDFKTTNKIIAHYASKQQKQTIFKFRYEMVMKYSEILQQCIEEGENRKKKQFMRQAIRN